MPCRNCQEGMCQNKCVPPKPVPQIVRRIQAELEEMSVNADINGFPESSAAIVYALERIDEILQEEKYD